MGGFFLGDPGNGGAEITYTLRLRNSQNSSDITPEQIFRLVEYPDAVYKIGDTESFNQLISRLYDIYGCVFTYNATTNLFETNTHNIYDDLSCNIIKETPVIDVVFKVERYIVEAVRIISDYDISQLFRISIVNNTTSDYIDLGNIFSSDSISLEQEIFNLIGNAIDNQLITFFNGEEMVVNIDVAVDYRNTQDINGTYYSFINNKFDQIVI